MDERRRSLRQRSSLRGRIFFNNGRTSVSCLIHDISYEGARIIIFDPIDGSMSVGSSAMHPGNEPDHARSCRRLSVCYGPAVPRAPRVGGMPGL
jgi:hypothetical protein